MRFRLGTLLFTVTVTAVALAAGKWLSRYHDRLEFVALVVLWAATGFAIGMSLPAATLTGRWRWAAPLGACLAYWLFYFFNSYPVGNLRDPQVGSTFPTILVIVLELQDGWIPLVATIASTAITLYAAQTNRMRLFAASVGAMLLFWFLVAWIGFLGTSAALLNDWTA